MVQEGWDTAAAVRALTDTEFSQNTHLFFQKQAAANWSVDYVRKYSNSSSCC